MGFLDTPAPTLKRVSAIGRPTHNTAVAIGDSNTALPGPTTGQTDGWFSQLCARSRQRVRHGGVFATAGYTIEQAETTHLPSILALNPTPAACFIMLGTNNCWANSGTTFNIATATTSYLRIVNALRINGVLAIPCLIYPNATTAQAHQNTLRWNRRLLDIANRYRLPVVDNHSALSDASTGAISSAFMLGDGNNVHANALGRRTVAEYALAGGVDKLFPPAPLLTARSAADVDNLVKTFYSTTTGWSSFNDTANATSSLVSPSTGDDLKGSWHQVVYTGTSNVLRQSNIATGGLAQGDVVAFSARMQVSGIEAAVAAGGSPNVLLRAELRSTSASLGYIVVLYQWSVDITDALVVETGVMPANIDGIRLQLQITGGSSAGSISARMGELTARNLTTQGAYATF